MGSQGGFPWDPRVGCPWDPRVGAHGIPGWALGNPGPWGPMGLGDPWALGTLGPWGPWALGALGPLGPVYYTDILPEIDLP